MACKEFAEKIKSVICERGYINDREDKWKGNA